MKILIVSEDVPHVSMGGLGKHALTLACALERTGHEVDFLGNDDLPFDSTRAEYGFRGEFFAGIHGHQLGGKEKVLGLFNPLKRPIIARRIARAIMQHAAAYDVVHYHGHSPEVASLIPRRVNFVQTRHDQGSDCLIHTRFRNHGICTETSPTACAMCATPNPNRLQTLISALSVKLYRALTLRAFKKHKTIFVSDMLRRNFCRTASEADWGCVIHNFIDYQKVRQYARQQPLDTDKVVALIVGKLWEPKGVDALLAEINGLVPSWMRLEIVGDGPNEDALRARYESEHVTFLGWQSYADTIGRMSYADLLVVSSIWEEPCATTVLEGLALGLPVFALARGGTPELAVYQRYQGQLRLFKDLRGLGNAMLAVETKTLFQDYHEFLGDVLHRLPALLEVYRQERLPPRQ